jgi:hypothetical protein
MITMGQLSGILSLIAYFLYFLSVITRKTIPNRVTWIVLSVIGLLIFLSSVELGATEAIWFQLSYFIGPFAIFLASIKYGEGGWSSLDMLCLSVSLLSILLWLSTSSPMTVLAVNIIADFFAIIPTIRKSYLNPESEASLPWILTCVASLLSVFTINNWVIPEYLYPMYMLVFNTLIVALVTREKLKQLFFKISI